jgi:hypothetical protein
VFATIAQLCAPPAVIDATRAPLAISTTSGTELHGRPSHISTDDAPS